MTFSTRIRYSSLRLFAPALLASALLHSGPALQAQQLEMAIQLPDRATNGVTTTPDGKRTFLAIAREEGSQGPQLVEWTPTGTPGKGTLTPYPNQAWNSWKPGQDAASGFQHVNAIRFGPDGFLWAVDVGTPSSANPVLAHGPKLVKINVQTNSIDHIYSLDGVIKPGSYSYLNDFRFNQGKVYMTDAGVPALIVMDLATGQARRVLDNQPSTRSRGPITLEGKTFTQHGKPVLIAADQIEISPDGQYLYFSPISGPLLRVPTAALNNTALTDAQREAQVIVFAKTYAIGGTAIDAKGNVYSSNNALHRIDRISPDGKMTTLVQDPRLNWVDAMWIDNQGYLWLPATQISRQRQFNNGVSKVQYPILVYRYHLGIPQAPNDHK